MSSLIGWSWSIVPSADKVSVRSIDGFFSLIVRLEDPSAIRCFNFCLDWLRWSGLSAVCQIRFIAWKQSFHFLWKFLTCCTTNELVCRLISWIWGEVPCTNKVRICSVNRLFCLVVRLKGPSAIGSLHFCFSRLCRGGFRAICQVRLVGWKQVFHCLWQFLTCCTTNELVSCLVSWRRCKVPGTNKVSVCSIDRLFVLIVRLEDPCTVGCFHFRLDWLCWSSLGAICQIRLVGWKQILHCLWQFLI